MENQVYRRVNGNKLDRKLNMKEKNFDIHFCLKMDKIIKAIKSIYCKYKDRVCKYFRLTFTYNF